VHSQVHDLLFYYNYLFVEISSYKFLLNKTSHYIKGLFTVNIRTEMCAIIIASYFKTISSQILHFGHILKVNESKLRSKCSSFFM
jgi:uncharacterized membrane protein